MQWASIEMVEVTSVCGIFSMNCLCAQFRVSVIFFVFFFRFVSFPVPIVH